MDTVIFNNNWDLVTLLKQILPKNFLMFPSHSLRVKSTANFENALKKSSLLINDSTDKFLMYKHFTFNYR